MDIETRVLQLELLKMMKVFHEICEKNNLTYFMLGGTCLGAIRHKGFIPWDDDMDVGMPREDYNKFCKIATKAIPKDYELRFYKTAKDSPFHFGKFINKNTTLIEPKYHNYVEGIYIDVFPLDYMSDYKLKNKIRCKKIWFTHACIMNHCSTEKKKGTLRPLFQKFSKLLSLRKLHNTLERLMIKENSKNANYMCNFLGAWKEREFIPLNIFGTPKLYEFEDSFFFGPEDADSYLRSLYNNYMELPPKEKRVCRHEYYFVSLDIPYRNYIERRDKDE